MKRIIILLCILAISSISEAGSRMVRQTTTSGVIKTNTSGVLRNYDDYIFVIVWGQSNAEGFGDSSLSPPCYNAIEVHTDGSIENNVIDPTGTGASPFYAANTGSSWPALCEKLYNLTGHKPILMSLGVPSAGLLIDPYGTGKWCSDCGGTLYDAANSSIQTAENVLHAAGYHYTKEIIIWWQGETEGQQSVTESQYQNSLHTLISDSISQHPDISFYMVKIKNNSSNDPNIRAALQAEADTNNRAFIAYDDTATDSDEHHTQSQYNDIGEAIALFLKEN